MKVISIMSVISLVLAFFASSQVLAADRECVLPSIPPDLIQAPAENVPEKYSRWSAFWVNGLFKNTKTGTTVCHQLVIKSVSKSGKVKARYYHHRSGDPAGYNNLSGKLKDNGTHLSMTFTSGASIEYTYSEAKLTATFDAGTLGQFTTSLSQGDSLYTAE